MEFTPIEAIVAEVIELGHVGGVTSPVSSPSMCPSQANPPDVFCSTRSQVAVTTKSSKRLRTTLVSAPPESRSTCTVTKH